MVHDAVEQGHDSFLGSSSFNSKQTEVVWNINFIIVLSSSAGFTYFY